MAPLIQLKGIGYGYNGKEVLIIPELVIDRACITGLAGPNGSGKTTLLKLLSGVSRPTTGLVSFHAPETGEQENRVRRRFCLLPQESYLLRRSVYENIAYGLRVRGMKKDIHAIIIRSLDQVGLPQEFTRRQWHELSGGEAQRVALAARLAVKPDCLLLDEPTASVDMESAKCIRRAVLLAKKEWGTTVIVASHNREWLNDICDRIVYLYNGRILESSFENILTGPWEDSGNQYVACNLSPDQKLYALNSPHRGKNAVISPNAFSINDKRKEAGFFSFQGVVVSVSFERHLGNPQIHVLCGEQRFIASISEASLASESYRPGQVVTFSYNTADVTWLAD